MYKPFQPFRVFCWSLLFTLALFIWLKAKGYYAIGLYPVYFSFGAVYLEKRLAKGILRYLQPVFFALPLVAFYLMYQVAFPNRSPAYIRAHVTTYRQLGLLRWEDGKDHLLPQDFADMLGWRELAQKTDSIYKLLSATGNTLVLCDNYGQAGAINYYSRAGIRAVSFNADYINWFRLDTPYKNLVRVKEADDNNREMTFTGPFFSRGWVADSIANPYAREWGTRIYAFEGAAIDINHRLQKEIAAKKRKNSD
ncbi:MAG: hypothetical protein QM664_05955 [Flavihumibacter sp.]